VLPSPSDKKAVIIFFVIKKRVGEMGIKYGRGRGGARISLSRGSVLSREYFPSSSYINSLSVILPASLGNSSKTTKKVKTRIPRCDHAEVPGGKK